MITTTNAPLEQQINYQFDHVLRGKFANPYVIIHAIRSILERFSINLPMLDDINGTTQEFTFSIAEEEVATGDEAHTGLFLYILIELDDRGHYEGFAQLVNLEELELLQNIDDVALAHHVVDSEEEQILPYTSNYLRQTRRTADD
jgi:hypothetical protein